MNELSTYRTMALKAATNPHKAAYKLGEKAASPLASVHTHLRTRKLRTQRNCLQELRRNDEYLLIVLDACRYDAFESVAPEYLTFDSTEPVRSAGRNTFEYVSRCWPDTYDDVTYVSAATPVNGDPRSSYDGEVLREQYGGYVPVEHIRGIRDVWRESWDESIGITPPEPVTDAALEADGDRLVVHYFQPHAPYVGRQPLLGHTNDEDSRPNEGEAVDAPVWSRARYGDLSRTELRRVYVSSLRRVLRAVRRLVAETSIETIAVMGDHGEALGEYGIYGHPDLDHPDVRTVPWAVVEGIRRDPGTDVVGAADATDTTDRGVTERLEDLGYL
jgi:hypothetical protein